MILIRICGRKEGRRKGEREKERKKEREENMEKLEPPYTAARNVK